MDARSIDGSMNSVWLSQNLTIASCKNSMVARWRLIDGQIVGNFIFTRGEKERLKLDYRGWIRNWIFYSRTDYFRQLNPSWTLCLGCSTIYCHLYVHSLVNIDILFFYSISTLFKTIEIRIRDSSLAYEIIVGWTRYLSQYTRHDET